MERHDSHDPAVPSEALRIDAGHAQVEGPAWDRALGRVAVGLERLLEARGRGTVGFLDLGSGPDAHDLVARCRSLVAEARASSDLLVVLGIGGSALGAKAVDEALSEPFRGWDDGESRWAVLDNVDPDTIAALAARIDPGRTTFNAISKSGRTMETLAQLAVFEGVNDEADGPFAPRVIVTTDPTSGPLRAWADERGIRSLPVPPNVGGRFSVLTAVGLFPLTWRGHDAPGLLAGAAAMASRCLRPVGDDNPAATLAALHLAHHPARDVAVLMPYADRLKEFGSWFVQLWSESLGKQGPDGHPFGWTALSAPGATDQHSQLQLFLDGPRDKVFTFLRVLEPSGTDRAIPAAPYLPAQLAGRTVAELLEAERAATALALAHRGQPSWTVEIPRIDARSMGALIMLFEAAAALTGLAAGVDPFDQPAVELGKRLALERLGGR
ncbi:glucose-6-phosphate isomerase [Myxococcota bacterium]|nr:glucose-6-phosphate isomerase [Myxococcota bacterium]